jgi:hypothetical protein
MTTRIPRMKVGKRTIHIYNAYAGEFWRGRNMEPQQFKTVATAVDYKRREQAKWKKSEGTEISDEEGMVVEMIVRG